MTKLPNFAYALLNRIEDVIPWAQVVAELLPTFPKASRGYPPECVESLIRLYLMWQWLGLSYAELVEVVEKNACAKAFARWDKIWGALQVKHLERLHHDWFHTTSATTLDALVNEALKRENLHLKKKNGAVIPVPIVGFSFTTRDWSFLVYLIPLYALELLLAILLSASWVKGAPWLLAFAASVEKVAPMVGYFDRIARYPEGLRVFLAVTFFFIPVKAWIVYRWFGAYLVVSPLAKLRNFTVDAALETSAEWEIGKQRSWPVLIFWSIMTLAFAVGVMIYILYFGDRVAEGKPEFLPSLRNAYSNIAYGGFSLWLAWCVLRVSVYAIVFAAAVRSIRDWCVFLLSFVTKRSQQ
jgi:hypothetical protein